MPDNYLLNFSDIGEHYRAIAGKLRGLAGLCAFVGARRPHGEGSRERDYQGWVDRLKG